MLRIVLLGHSRDICARELGAEVNVSDQNIDADFG
jgi:hypothetical protein